MFSMYVWLQIHQMVINCTQSGCISVSLAHFDYLVGIGALEVIFEVAGIVKIFSKKGNGDANKNI